MAQKNKLYLALTQTVHVSTGRSIYCWFLVFAGFFRIGFVGNKNIYIRYTNPSS